MSIVQAIERNTMYKVGDRVDKGDRVVIKPDALCKSNKLTFSRLPSLTGTDRVVTITGSACSDECGARYPNSDKEWHIDEDWILGYAFDYGEEIEVSDNGQTWFKRRFCAYVPDRNFLVCTRNSMYMYARPIKEPTIKITVEVNGELKDPSFLSEETWATLRK